MNLDRVPTPIIGALGTALGLGTVVLTAYTFGAIWATVIFLLLCTAPLAAAHRRR